jgi:dolichol-phosphate mannosyltransferase
MSIVHPDFLSYFFWRHHVLRFSDAFNHQEPWWYFAPVLLIAMFPSSFLIPSLGRWLWKSGRRGEDQLSMEVGFLVMFSCWILFFFSLSEAKLPTYILPAFPAVSLLLGSMLRKRLFQQDFVTPQQDWFWQVPLHSSRVLFLGVALAILAGFFIQNRQNDLSEIWLLSLLLVAISLLSFVQIFHDPRLWRWLASAGLGLLLIGIVVEMLVPIISYQRSIYVAAREIKRQPGCDTLPIVFFEHEDYGSDLWFRDQEAIYFDDEDSRQMVRFLKSKQHVLIISRDHDVHELSKNLEWPLAISKVADARHLYFCHDRQEKVSVPKLDESWSENRD